MTPTAEGTPAARLGTWGDYVRIFGELQDGIRWAIIGRKESSRAG